MGTVLIQISVRFMFSLPAARRSFKTLCLSSCIMFFSGPRCHPAGRPAKTDRHTVRSSSGIRAKTTGRTDEISITHVARPGHGLWPCGRLELADRKPKGKTPTSSNVLRGTRRSGRSVGPRTQSAASNSNATFTTTGSLPMEREPRG